MYNKRNEGFVGWLSSRTIKSYTIKLINICKKKYFLNSLDIQNEQHFCNTFLATTFIFDFLLPHTNLYHCFWESRTKIERILLFEDILMFLLRF